MISEVFIANFKSIKQIDISCKRINLFIGKSNVGKSNILEALAIFGQTSIIDVRFESMRNLFYDQDLNNIIGIQVDGLLQLITHNPKEVSYDSQMLSVLKFSDFNNVNDIDKHLKERRDRGTLVSQGYYEISGLFRERSIASPQNSYSPTYPNMKKYSFEKQQKYENDQAYNSSLNHPYGENLFELLKNNRSFAREVSGLFKENGYGLVIDSEKVKVEIQKVIDHVSYKIPYALVADTLQRIIFYTIAIKSNQECAILLEEPESHSFPPYIRDIALQIVESSNQFFIATHSPYLLNTIISEAPKEDVAVHIVSYDNFETKVKTMSESELAELSNYGIDVFFNLDMFSE